MELLLKGLPPYYKGVGLGTPIAIHHSDEKGKNSVSRLPSQLENGDKLYKLIKENLK